MASNFEDLFLDFDLNCFREPIVDQHKQRKALAIAKKKIISTNELIKKFELKNELLDQKDRLLAALQEECKQIRVNYDKVVENYSRSEKEVQKLSNANQAWEEKYIYALNCCEALKSHSNQLQILIKQLQTQIDGLKIENNLEKNNTRDLQKRVASLKRKNENITNHIRLFLNKPGSKGALTRNGAMLLNKCEENADTCNEEFENFYTGSDKHPENDEVLETIPAITKHNLVADCIEEENSTLNKDENDKDSDCSHDVVSDDTGFESPDYLTNDSLSPEITSSNEIRMRIDIATSPLTVVQSINTATSPIIFETCDFDRNSGIIMRDKATSPIKITFLDKSSSPVKKTSNEIATSPITVQNTSTQIIHDCETNIEEIECLELNKSNNLTEDYDSDCEVQMILNKMRMTHKLITPIPKTPTKSHESVVTHVTKAPTSHVEPATCECPETARLSARVSQLEKEMMEIKNNLANQKMSEKEASVQHPNLINHNDCGNSILILDEYINEEGNDADNTNPFENGGPIQNIANSMQFQDTLSRTIQQNLLPADQACESSLPSAKNSTSCNTSRNLQFVEELEFDSENDTRAENQNVSDLSISNAPDKVQEKNKKGRRKKLTRLEKFRNKMVPKSKIQRPKTPPIKQLRYKPKQLVPCSIKNTTGNSAASLNDKRVYEKAVKIMAELNAKQQKNYSNSSSNRKTSATFADRSDEITGIHKKESLKATSNDNDVRCNSASRINTSSPKTCVTTRSRSKQTVQNEHDAISSPIYFKVSEEMHSDHQKQFTNVNVADSPERKNRKRSKSASLDEIQSHSKQIAQNEQDAISSPISPKTNNLKQQMYSDHQKQIKNVSMAKSPEPKNRKLPKRASLDESEIQNKRILRSSNTKQSIDDTEGNKSIQKVKDQESPVKQTSTVLTFDKYENKSVLIMDDDITVDASPNKRKCQEKDVATCLLKPQQSTFCKILEKYGIFQVKNNPRKISDTAVNSMAKKIEEGIAQILDSPQTETKQAMKEFVEEIRKWNVKHFLAGLMKYLKDPQRKLELFKKDNIPTAPPMSKQEQILLYIVTHLNECWPNVDIVKCVLDNIEYTLFKLNRTPEFDTIESMSHFYAILCRRIKAMSRLRLFILNAMYCIQFKAVPLIKQCIDVWMHILPLAHMGMAKTPLVTCIVYLLHFFKCKDRFNRVSEIRNILSRKYSYVITDWNETKILELFENSIMELKENQIEEKMLRIALIILAKRQGSRWCQNNIIKNMLQPMIANSKTPERAKLFCVSVIGALLKPYAGEMKVHCEIVMNQLFDILEQNPSHRMQEAIFTSLIFMSKHNQNRVVEALLSWAPDKVSPDMEDLLKSYIREKPVKVWKIILSKIP